MQILYVGNGNYKHRGARYYDPGRKLVNGLTRLGHNVYLFSDRDEARTLWGTRKLGIKHCNRVFLDVCTNFKPDLIVFCFADIISLDSLAKVRQRFPAVKMAQFNVDPIFRPHNMAMIHSKLPHMDATFVTTAGPILKRFHRDGARVSFVPNITDSSMEWSRCHERSDQPIDVFWALRAPKGSYAGDPRIECPRYLKHNGVSMDFHGMDGTPELFNAEYYAAISRARMGLNISVDRTDGTSPRASDAELYLYSSDRIAHYTGSGLLTFSMRDNKLEELFAEDKEMVFFSRQEELLEKIRYYKTHDEERKSIAKAGWEKAHHCFNERVVAKYIVETTLGLPLSGPYAWPTETY